MLHISGRKWRRISCLLLALHFPTWLVRSYFLFLSPTQMKPSREVHTSAAWIALKVFCSELSTFLQDGAIDNTSRMSFLPAKLKLELVSLGAALNLFSTVLPQSRTQGIWPLTDMEDLLSMGTAAFDVFNSPSHAFHHANIFFEGTGCEPFVRVCNAWKNFIQRTADARASCGGKANDRISCMAQRIHERLQGDHTLLVRLERRGIEAYHRRGFTKRRSVSTSSFGSTANVNDPVTEDGCTGHGSSLSDSKEGTLEGMRGNVLRTESELRPSIYVNETAGKRDCREEYPRRDVL